MSNVAGIILSNLHDREVPMLTRKRTMGAVPFGGRYRMVDFPLSGMVHAKIQNIFIIAHHNYQSLMEHIGSGKDWDLARHHGGVRILPPYSAAYANPAECYDSRLQSLISIRGLIDRVEEAHVLCADCDCVAAPDLGKFLAAHEKSGAPMTIGVDRDQAAGRPDLHIWVAQTAFLRELLREAEAQHYTSFSTDVVRRQLLQGTVATYRFEETFYRIHSINDYYRCHILLATSKMAREALFGCEARPILSRMHNAPPVKYGENAAVENALIAEGCVIEGRVRNSVLFSGVRIGVGCEVENAILFEGCRLEPGARIHSGILDKNVLLSSGVELHGHDTLPILVEEGKMIG